MKKKNSCHESPRLGKGELVCVVLLVHFIIIIIIIILRVLKLMSFSPSYWWQGLATACDWGTPWPFLLTVMVCVFT